MKNSEVIYDGKEYILLHQYVSGYCEIQEKHNRFNIKLVHVSQLEKYFSTT